VYLPSSPLSSKAVISAHGLPRVTDIGGASATLWFLLPHTTEQAIYDLSSLFTQSYEEHLNDITGRNVGYDG
jgi:hypothetical protein